MSLFKKIFDFDQKELRRFEKIIAIANDRIQRGFSNECNGKKQEAEHICI